MHRLARAGTVLAVAAAGCASTAVVVPIETPEEIPARRYARISVATFDVDPAVPAADARLGGDLADRIADALSASAGLSAVGIDRGDVADARAAGGNAAPQARIAGRILSYGVTESLTRSEVNDPARGVAVKYARMARARLSAEIRFADARDSSAARIDTLEAEERDETHDVDRRPADVDTALLRDRLLSRIADDYLRRCLPRRERDVVVFLLDGRYPSVAKGVVFARRGRWREATAAFDSAAGAAAGREDEDRLLYNVGMATLYAGNFRAAEAAFLRADSIRRSERYENAVDLVHRKEREWLRARRAGAESP